MSPSIRLDPDTLLSAYSQGLFPMADAYGRVQWYSANPRGIIPLEAFHVPRTLRAVLRRGVFEVRVNCDFEATMRACMNTRPGETWINERLLAAYVQLHQLGHAHSVESWQAGRFAGGLYGVSLGGAFFGESMFHYRPDASKVALVYLVQRLRERGFELLDTQTITPHLARFGCTQIPPKDYLRRLRQAIQKNCRFD